MIAAARRLSGPAPQFDDPVAALPDRFPQALAAASAAPLR